MLVSAETGFNPFFLLVNSDQKVSFRVRTPFLERIMLCLDDLFNLFRLSVKFILWFCHTAKRSFIVYNSYVLGAMRICKSTIPVLAQELSSNQKEPSFKRILV